MIPTVRRNVVSSFWEVSVVHEFAFDVWAVGFEWDTIVRNVRIRLSHDVVVSQKIIFPNLFNLNKGCTVTLIVHGVTFQ